VSGMIGGILAGAIIERLEGHSGLHGWQWLFIVSPRVRGLGGCLGVSTPLTPNHCRKIGVSKRVS